MANLSIKEMINAGVHFGHQSKYWNPKMRPYIYTTYKKLHIINLEESVSHFNTAITFIEKLTKNNAKILFVGTKRAARDLIGKYATEAKMPYVNNRWLGGMLTNFDTIKKSIAKLDSLKAYLDLATLNGLTKKESLNVKKQIAKLEKNLSGIKNLDNKPDALFVIDTRYEKIAIQEANKLNIPVIAIVDSNNSFEGVDYMIPGNDDSMSSIDLFLKSVTDVIMNTKSKFIKPASQANEGKPTDSSAKMVKKKQVLEVEVKSDKKNIEEV
ncbi:MAG: 30S ribosomal protein S2 [Gammaproteobacteria bacterium]|nr:30S ribosomal protein S2 [Gammaproteobacteria bacterium]MBT4462142.1 30S ribosomal protein S2 [Gammaproteobacteria bacterium]MBT4655001.1 30S ribosomal protein S2 [Gammaproteobacteria bacterium]MBT5116485.1 30S ribosomal protein S2 [Gammaproteobacteria bacterium]MBT5761514.1 30S ribosomal protein S2 [Gammaproteobacteria bacterium]